MLAEAWGTEGRRREAGGCVLLGGLCQTGWDSLGRGRAVRAFGQDALWGVRPDRELRPQRVGQKVARCGAEGEIESLESRRRASMGSPQYCQGRCQESRWSRPPLLVQCWVVPFLCSLVWSYVGLNPEFYPRCASTAH